MNLHKLTSLVSRALFIGALLFIVLAGLERVVNLFGYTILTNDFYSPSRLLEFAVIFLVVVIAFLLRDVREELRKASRTQH